MVDIEHKNIEKSDKKLDVSKTRNKSLFELVRDMGYDWKKVKFDLAKWAGINDYTTNDSKKNYEQNIKIREKILSGERFKPDLEQSIFRFSESKQQKIKQMVGKNEFSLKHVAAYFSNLSSEKKQILNNLSDEKFFGFLHEELSLSQRIKEKIPTQYGSEIEDATKEQLANIIAITEMEGRLNGFISKNPQLEKYRVSKQESEAEYLRIIPIDQRNILKSEPLKEELVKRQIANAITAKRIRESKEIKDIGLESKKEFDSILVDVYRYNEKTSPELNEIYFTDMKAEIEQKEREINSANLNISKSFTDSQKTVLANKEFNHYFKDHYINEFVSEEKKDQKYRDNLQKLYPDSKKIIQAVFIGSEDYKKCFDEDGNINKNELDKLPKDKQYIFSAKVKEKLNTVDQEFVGNINSAVKEQSVETCLASLSKCMNIKFDDGTKEDMIKNFDFASQMNDDLVVDFNGTLNGKKINLSYDMINGKVLYKEYLSKDNETNTFKKNNPDKKTEMYFVKLPKLEDFISISKSFDYVSEMGDSTNLNEFNLSVKNKINSQIQKNIDIKDASHDFEKSILRDITMQEIFSFMGYGDNKNLSNIDKIEEPNLYRLYSIFYESISFYSLDELKSFRQCINSLNKQKSKISDNYNNLNVSKKQMNNDVELNQEKVFFDLLMNNSISKYYSKKDSLDNSYLSFFECFISDETKPLSVIDLSKMQDYIGKLNKEINNDADNVLQWKRSDLFKKNLGRIRDNYEVLVIEKNF